MDNQEVENTRGGEARDPRDERMEQMMAEMAYMRVQMAELMSAINRRNEAGQNEQTRQQNQQDHGQSNQPNHQTGGRNSQNRAENAHGLNEEDSFDDLDDYLRKRKEEASKQKQEVNDPRVDELSQKVDKMTRIMQDKGESSDLDLEYLLDNDGMPTRFKMPDLIKFDGTGDPRMHLKQYAVIMSTTGIGKAQILRFFMLSLQGAVLTWYHDQEKWVREDWGALSENFIKQYGYNTHMEVTLHDLEHTKQKFGEDFADYIARWRNKAAKMRNRPDERDQVRMAVRGAHPAISEKLRYTVVRTFGDLMEVGLLIEEAESENRRSFMKRGTEKGATGSGSGSGYGTEGSQSGFEIRAIQSRKFSDLGIPMSKALERLKAKGLLQPLPPRQGAPPLNADMSLYCHFHQVPGHSTDRCARLRHEIQNLIDAGKITDPETGRPSNPSPNHKDVPSSKCIFMISNSMTEEDVIDSFEDCKSTDEEPNDSGNAVEKRKVEAVMLGHQHCRFCESMPSAHDEQMNRLSADVETLKKQVADLMDSFIKLFGQGKVGQEPRPRQVQTSGQSSRRESDNDRENPDGRTVQKRKFSDLRKPLSKIFEDLQAKGLLQPRPPRHGEIPAHVNRSYYCQFHRAFGHPTDKCTRLRHEIQDLVDSGKIPRPKADLPSTS